VRYELDGRRVGMLGGLDTVAKVLRHETIETFVLRMARQGLIFDLFAGHANVAHAMKS